jgi:hypothetical protein
MQLEDIHMLQHCHKICPNYVFWKKKMGVWTVLKVTYIHTYIHIPTNVQNWG